MTSESTSTSAGGAILGLDNVRLDLPIAGVGSRALAGLLDYLLLLLLIAMWWAGGIMTAQLLDFGQGWMWALIGLGSFLLQWSYFAVLEIVMDGQTPGKHVLGIRVVSSHGGRSSAGALLVRNLVRAVDVFFGLAVMAVDGRSRRLGDLAAGTLVIHQRPPDEEDEIRLGRLPESWGSREVVVAESFLRRAARMEPALAQSLAEKMLRWIARQDSAFVAAAGETENVASMHSRMDRVSLLRRLLRAESLPSAARLDAPPGEAEAT